MKVVVLANDVLKDELSAQGISDRLQVEWISDPASFDRHTDADAWIDLLFDGKKERITRLQQLLPKPVIIDAVSSTLKDLPGGFVRINGWTTFLKRPVLEAAAGDAVEQRVVESIIGGFGKTVAWVPDVPGFVSARVVSMIINEAYFALAEQVSTKQEIDTAMKLGTNYPFGPFEWSEQIGLKNIGELLEVLEKDQSRYQPAMLLQKEMTN
jgi:3-hydroxybutyryl-CoA dehydrogenase